jgi:hypothetical protein
VGACLDAELVGHIRAQILGSRLHGEGYRKIWARLRHAGIRTAATAIKAPTSASARARSWTCFGCSYFNRVAAASSNATLDWCHY